MNYQIDLTSNQIYCDGQLISDAILKTITFDSITEQTIDGSVSRISGAKAKIQIDSTSVIEVNVGSLKNFILNK